MTNMQNCLAFVCPLRVGKWQVKHLLDIADVDIHAGYTRLCQILIHVLYSPAHLF